MVINGKGNSSNSIWQKNSWNKTEAEVATRTVLPPHRKTAWKQV